jgi:carboxylesterase type B
MSKDADTIADIHKELLDPLRDGIAIFKPSLEIPYGSSTFISELPIEMAKRGNFTKVPWIHGVNSEEGLIFSAGKLISELLVN